MALKIFLGSAGVPESGKPMTAIMVAGPGSTLASAFNNHGGWVTFSDLVVSSRPDASGESIALAGRMEWTC